MTRLFPQLRLSLPASLSLPRTLALIVGLAFALRLSWALLYWELPITAPSDAWFYHHAAQAIAAGQGFLHPGTHQPTAYYSPGFPYLLGALYAWLGAHVWVGRALNVLLATLMVYLTYRLGRRFVSERVGVVAAGLMALFPSQIFWTSAVMSEPLFGCLALLTLEVAFSRHPGRAWGVGVLLALIVLVRSQGALLLPLVLLGLLDRHALKASATRAAIAVVVMALTLAPWLFRNYQLFGHPVLTTNSGVNLVMGTYPGADGSFIDADFDALLALPPETGEYERDRAYRQAGFRFVLEDPARFVGLIPRKLYLFFRTDLACFQQSKQASTEALWQLFWWVLGRQPLPSLDLAVIVGALAAQGYYLLVSALAAIAVLRQARQERFAVGLFAGVCAIFTAFHVLYVSSERYHFLVIPFFALLASMLLVARLTPSKRVTPAY